MVELYVQHDSQQRLIIIIVGSILQLSSKKEEELLHCSLSSKKEEELLRILNSTFTYCLRFLVFDNFLSENLEIYTHSLVPVRKF
jgi:hypothetical protein